MFRYITLVNIAKTPSAVSLAEYLKKQNLPSVEDQVGTLKKEAA